MKTRLIVALFCTAVVIPSAVQAQQPINYEKLPPEIRQAMDQRLKQIKYPLALTASSRATRGGVRDERLLALLTVLTEQGLAERGKQLGIKVTPEQALAFITPQLIRQGLIDGSEGDHLLESENMKKYLTAQEWTPQQFVEFACAYLLWAQIETRDTTVTKEQVRKFVAEHPALAVIPERVSLVLTTVELPDDTPSTRGLGAIPQSDILTSYGVISRAQQQEPIPDAKGKKAWAGLRLYLPLDRLDPVLRGDLGNRKPGESFGPLTLSNGIVVSGRIERLIPSTNAVQSPAFWQYASLMTALSLQPDADAKFKDAMDKAFADNPTVRGVWGDVLGVVGGAVGTYFGAPTIGAVAGSLVGGWIDQSGSKPAPAANFSQPQWNQQVNQASQNFSPPPMNAGFNFGPMQNAFNPGVMAPPGFIPMPPPSYATMWPLPQYPPPGWMPPFAMPMMARCW